MSAQQVANLTRQIDSEIKKLETQFAPALTGAVSIGFFTQKASQVLPIIAKCTLAENIIPPIPGGLIKRSQFSNIKKRLEEFSSKDFPELETQLSTYITSPEATTKATALAQIVKKIPSIIADYVLMKRELNKVKKALRV